MWPDIRPPRTDKTVVCPYNRPPGPVLPGPAKQAERTQWFDFESALETLEQLVGAMEEGELSLEESLKAFEQGIKLTRECQKALEKAEQKVQILVQADGVPEAEDYESDVD